MHNEFNTFLKPHRAMCLYYLTQLTLFAEREREREGGGRKKERGKEKEKLFHLFIS